MDLAQLIEALSDPAAYPDPVGEVEVRQTHISAVFLAGPHVYKVKKPVELGFLDFSTLAKRRHFCEEEVRLNRRLAPEVYLGVVPVTRDDQGGAGGGRRRGRRVGGEDAAPARRGHAPGPAPAGRGRRRGGGGPGAQDRRLPRARRVGPAGRRLRALRGGGRQRPRELRAVRGPCRHHRQRAPCSRELGHSPKRPWPATAP